ncbi:D-aminoacyl-tRNA deacylase [Paenibacillus xylanexedens]|uniref:D-aminoacyl-tRNA deacylase n=1 Tax=Paenibacillus xylanexedens TaxID=528191 RepID=UPI0034D97BC3
MGAGAKADVAERLYEVLNELVGDKGIEVETGGLGGMMDVRLRNWGGVSVMVESGNNGRG